MKKRAIWLAMRLIDILIVIYQATLSVWLGPVCRFEPSCSHYARDAFRLHGFCKGGIITLRRLARCRPGGGFGYDPVPLPTKIDATHDRSLKTCHCAYVSQPKQHR